MDLRLITMELEFNQLGRKNIEYNDQKIYEKRKVMKNVKCKIDR